MCFAYSVLKNPNRWADLQNNKCYKFLLNRIQFAARERYFDISLMANSCGHFSSNRAIEYECLVEVSQKHYSDFFQVNRSTFEKCRFQNNRTKHTILQLGHALVHFPVWKIVYILFSDLYGIQIIYIQNFIRVSPAILVWIEYILYVLTVFNN